MWLPEEGPGDILCLKQLPVVALPVTSILLLFDGRSLLGVAWQSSAETIRPVFSTVQPSISPVPGIILNQSLIVCYAAPCSLVLGLPALHRPRPPSSFARKVPKCKLHRPHVRPPHCPKKLSSVSPSGRPTLVSRICRRHVRECHWLPRVTSHESPVTLFALPFFSITYKLPSFCHTF